MAGLKNTLQDGIDKFVPKKTISRKSSLPWITQEIWRNMRKRDSYQKYKSRRTPKEREEFVQMRHQVRRKLNLAHNQYLQEILGISKKEDASEPGKSSHSAKKLYAMLNRSKNDSPLTSMVSFTLRAKTRPISLTTNFSRFLHPKHHWHSAVSLRRRSRT